MQHEVKNFTPMKLGDGNNCAKNKHSLPQYENMIE